MASLTRAARETIRWWYAGDDPAITVTIAGYIRHYFPDGTWHGDACGCVDDRCIGYHHDAGEECRCLEAWLDQWVTEQQAAAAAGPIWTAYRAAVEAGDSGACDAAWAAAESWVRRYHRGAETFSLDALVGDCAGISIRTRFNDLDHLVWAAPAAVLAP